MKMVLKRTWLKAFRTASASLRNPSWEKWMATVKPWQWAVAWQPEGGDNLTESYVNLIPTPQGGTHVNGFRSGLLAAIREFCEFRKLIPRGVKLAPDDIWDRCSYVLSAKMSEPQFSGQTKERLSSRQCASFVNGVVKDAFSLWLNHHTEAGERLAEMAHRQTPAIGCGRARKSNAKKSPPARPCPANWQIASARTRRKANCFWWRAIRPVDRPSRPATGKSRR